MSHISTMGDLLVLCLKSLQRACERLGLEFVEGQLAYKWYGTSVGDYPLPQGFSTRDLGKCLHAIRIPGNNQAYEIGVCKRRDGQPGYQLLWDFWQGGYGLEAVVGKNGDKLLQAYAVEQARQTALDQGYVESQIEEIFDPASQDIKVVINATDGESETLGGGDDYMSTNY